MHWRGFPLSFQWRPLILGMAFRLTASRNLFHTLRQSFTHAYPAVTFSITSCCFFFFFLVFGRMYFQKMSISDIAVKPNIAFQCTQWMASSWSSLALDGYSEYKSVAYLESMIRLHHMTTACCSLHCHVKKMRKMASLSSVIPLIENYSALERILDIFNDNHSPFLYSSYTQCDALPNDCVNCPQLSCL